jgi:hypothetical protein
MSQPPEFVNIELWKADAIVLFNWLMSVELNEVPITHRAEKQALMDLLTQLEVQTGVLGNFSRRDRRRSRRGLEEYGLVAAPSFPRKRLPDMRFPPEASLCGVVAAYVRRSPLLHRMIARLAASSSGAVCTSACPAGTPNSGHPLHTNAIVPTVGSGQAHNENRQSLPPPPAGLGRRETRTGNAGSSVQNGGSERAGSPWGYSNVNQSGQCRSGSARTPANNRSGYKYIAS